MNKVEDHPGWTYYDIFMIIVFIFFLTLKEVKIETFLWAPKSSIDPGYHTPIPHRESGFHSKCNFSIERVSQLLLAASVRCRLRSFHL